MLNRLLPPLVKIHTLRKYMQTFITILFVIIDSFDNSMVQFYAMIEDLTGKARKY